MAKYSMVDVSNAGLSIPKKESTFLQYHDQPLNKIWIDSLDHNPVCPWQAQESDQ